jgi:NIMA (never in mitosis gene a)-related kinase
LSGANGNGSGEGSSTGRYQVLHRDLKPENGETAAMAQSLAMELNVVVFLSDEFVKLGDFGLSKDMGTAAFTSTYVGVGPPCTTLISSTEVSQTPLYMPPEILAENRYDTKSDIWSLGCLVFEMCALT